MDNEKLMERLRQRRDAQHAWLHERHPEVFREQRHCDDGSAERAYWHFGSMAALSDIIDAMEIEARAESGKRWMILGMGWAGMLVGGTAMYAFHAQAWGAVCGALIGLAIGWFMDMVGA